jgi:ABC-type polysaccharide/polyol phosphate transport system ATPase subunit
MRLMDENEVIQRRAGIVWKNLKVCGSGSAINLQKNVGSLFMAPLRFGEFFGKSQEKTILNEFDGVLKSGEMLVVLGRPGSGCSTLLKTLTGELHGLDMKSQSEIHYNGMIFLLISGVSTMSSVLLELVYSPAIKLKSNYYQESPKSKC